MHRPLVLNRKPDLLARLMAVRKDLPRVRCAIVHPCDPNSIEGAHLAAKAGLIDPVLVGAAGEDRAGAGRRRPGG